MFSIPINPVRATRYPEGGRPRPIKRVQPRPSAEDSPVPRPPYRALSVLRVEGQDGGLIHNAPEIAATCPTMPIGKAMLLPGSGGSGSSLRVLEDDARLKWAGVWVDLAWCVADESSVLCELKDRRRDQLLFLFQTVLQAHCGNICQAGDCGWPFVREHISRRHRLIWHPS